MADSNLRRRPVMALALVLALVAILSAFGLIGAQAYVRWSMNQNFTFVGGNVIEALLIAGFGTLCGLIYIRNRS